jgi:hypothetical protein
MFKAKAALLIIPVVFFMLAGCKPRKYNSDVKSANSSSSESSTGTGLVVTISGN